MVDYYAQNIINHAIQEDEKWRDDVFLKCSDHWVSSSNELVYQISEM